MKIQLQLLGPRNWERVYADFLIIRFWYNDDEDELPTLQAILDNSPSKLEHLVEEGASLCF